MPDCSTLQAALAALVLIFTAGALHSLPAGAAKSNQAPGWPRARIAAVLKSKQRTRVNQVNKLPVHIVYATVWRGEGGSVEFRPGIYGRGRKLYRALFAKPTP